MSATYVEAQDFACLVAEKLYEQAIFSLPIFHAEKLEGLGFRAKKIYMKLLLRIGLAYYEFFTFVAHDFC